MMTLCNDGHDDVCYDSTNCPVCEEQKKISDLEDKIYDLNEEIKELNERL
jgi:peptidoglycan hydrolase CwlO-like protein